MLWIWYNDASSWRNRSPLHVVGCIPLFERKAERMTPFVKELHRCEVGKKTVVFELIGINTLDISIDEPEGVMHSIAMMHIDDIEPLIEGLTKARDIAKGGR